MSDQYVRTVIFPVIGPGGVMMNKVVVEPMPMLDRNERFAMAPGHPGIVDILMDARAVEPTASRLDGVIVTFGQKGFTGTSFGLALALADRLCRSGRRDGVRIYATGAIPAQERGKIAAIEGFEEKAAAVLDDAARQDQPVAFAFPKANLIATGEATRTALDAAGKAGRVRLIPCDTLCDASELWDETLEPAGSRRRVGVAAGLVVAFIAALFAWHYLARSDIRACEAAATALPADNPPRDNLAYAAGLCDKAVEHFPDDGRLHFLVGQLRALDRSPVLAQASWKRSAELGDLDGMATYGRALWRTDESRIDEALRWLEPAAKAGSVTAVGEIGQIYLHLGYTERAARWLLKEREMLDAIEAE